MKAGFVTCVELGLSCMEAIYNIGGSLDCVVTLPKNRAAKKSGRIYPEEFCRKHHIDVFHAANINDPQVVAYLKGRGLQWLFIIGWSQIARRHVLEAPSEGVIGAHPTLLPKGRGRAAIPWTILKGLRSSGVSLFQLDEGVDSGPILDQVAFDVSETEDASSLYLKVKQAHKLLMRAVWPQLVTGTIELKPQNDAEATVWPGRRPQDGAIHSEMTIGEVERLVRAVTHPYPGAFFSSSVGIVRIWRGRIGDPQVPPEDNVFRIQLRDGVYDATEFEVKAAEECS